jgi:hypothetical protein
MSPAAILLVTTVALAVLAAFCVRSVHATGLPWGFMSLALLVTANAAAWPPALTQMRPGSITAVALILTANAITLTATALMHRSKDAATEKALREARYAYYTSESRIRREERRRGL